MEFSQREQERMSAYMLAYAHKAIEKGLRSRLAVNFESCTASAFEIEDDLLEMEDLSKFKFDPLDDYSMEEVHGMLDDYMSELKRRKRYR